MRALQWCAARGGSSEEEPPGKAPMRANPRWRFRRTPSRGSALKNKHRGEYSNKRDIKERLRGATPREALQMGETRDGSSEEGPSGEAPQRASSEVKAWLECAPWKRFRRTAAGESPPGEMTLEIAPKSDPSGKGPRHQLKRRTLRGELTKEKAPPHLGGSKKNAPSGG